MSIEYVVTRTRGSTEWAMTESDGAEHHDIYRSVDNRSMRVVAIFDAPSWEDGKRFFDYLLGGRALFKDKLNWEEVRLMLEDGSQHAQMAEDKR